MRKKVLSIIVFLFIVALLFMFTKTRTIENLMGAKPKNAGSFSAELSDVTSESENESRACALAEGCYKGNDYVLEIVDLEGGESNTYNAMLYRRDTGACVFSGSAFEVPKDESSVCFVSGSASHLLLNAEKTSDNGDTPELKVDVTYKDAPLSYMGGEYAYIGETWVADADVNAENIIPGRYRSENNVFLLNVTEENGLVSFNIVDIYSQRTVFSGKSCLSEPENYSGFSSVTLQNNVGTNSAPMEKISVGYASSSQMIRFVKGTTENGVRFVEVTDHSINDTQDEYVGKYVYEGREYLTTGEYFSNGRTLKIIRSTIKGKKSETEIYGFNGIITLSDEDGTVLFSGSKEFSGNDRVRSVSFEKNDGEIAVFKGFDGDKEYVEVIDLGYTESTGSCERYFPSAKTSE